MKYIYTVLMGSLFLCMVYSQYKLNLSVKDSTACIKQIESAIELIQKQNHNDPINELRYENSVYGTGFIGLL